MVALPAHFYRNPEEVLDRIRAERVSKEKRKFDRITERRAADRNKPTAGLTEEEKNLIPETWLIR
jgi:hypothetical protein